MALVVTFRLPISACDILAPKLKGDELRAAIKHCLEDGIKNDVPIGNTDVSLNGLTERFNISVNEMIGSRIRLLANEMGLKERHICQGVLLAMVSRNKTSGNPASLEFNAILVNLQAAGIAVTERPEQTQFFLNLMDSLGLESPASSRGSIGMCEAGTGTGKTLAMLAAAKYRLDASPESRIVIACHSIMLMEQFVSQYNKMKAAGINMPKLRTIVGRREFISPAEVRHILQSGKISPEIDIDIVNSWIESGGIQSDESRINLPWLATTLAMIAPGFPIAAAIIPDSADNEDPGVMAYRSQFHIDEADPTNEIILCSHAMLAIDTKKRMMAAGRDEEYRRIQGEINGLFQELNSTNDNDKKGRSDVSALINEKRTNAQLYGAMISMDDGVLPPYHYLLIDEAHMVEQNFSNALSNYVSLLSFLAGMREYNEKTGKLKAKSVEYARAQIQKLVQIGAGIDTLSLRSSTPVAEMVVDILKEIVHAAGVIRSIKSNDDRSLIRLKTDLSCLVAASEKMRFTQAYIQFSPVRAFPRIFIGASSVDNALSFLWAGCKNVACVSATLYLPRGDGFSSGYQASLLSIPQERLREYQPVVPQWIYSTVEGVYLPESHKDANGHIWLRPPTRRDNLGAKKKEGAEDSWLSEVTDAVSSIYRDAQGGMLVLMTSYAYADALASKLPMECKSGLVLADNTTTLATQRARFLSHYRHGRKPIWLAVGSAWTGLDVGGHKPWHSVFGEDELPADQDNVLTDLIIPRLPFGTNKSITHMTRIERNSKVPWEVLDVFFRTKQAMGRLIRREGLPVNRRIFILDGRLNDPDFGGYLSRIQALSNGYRQKIFKKKV